MTPANVQAWVQVVQVLAAVGINIAQGIKAMIHHAQPTLTDAEINAAYEAILADDAVRKAWADLASRAV